MEHTPGPWVVRRATPQAMRRCELGSDGWQPIAAREKGEFICIIVDCEEWQGNIPPYGAIAAIPGDGPEALANASLIAAAPELLEELQRIEEGWAKRNENKPGFQPLNLWERERLLFIRQIIAKVKQI